MTTTAPTTKQLEFIELLCRKLRLSQDEAIAAAGVQPPLDIAAASQLIDHLKDKLDSQEEGEGGAPEVRRNKTPPASARSGASGTSAAPLNATELRLISRGEMPERSSMTDDENWILYRLAKLTDLEQAIGEPVAWLGANQGAPIRLEHLVEYFGSIEAVATAFKVSVGTVRNGWGGVLPANRVHEAAWLTRGYVTPPR